MQQQEADQIDEYKKKQKKKRAEVNADLLEVPPGWTEPEFKESDNPHGLLEVSTFATLYPAYREKYIRKCWPLIKKEFAKHHLECELNLVEGSMSVQTTRKTYDPFVVIKARECLRLIARSVPFEQAVRVFDDNNTAEIIKIGGLVRNRDRFVKRRQRLIGPNGATLKAIEMLTGCYVLVQGNTVSAIGPYNGLKQVRNIVEDCMRNVHPVYNIRTMMIKRELARNPAMKSENWDRFLPKFKKRNVKRRKPKTIKKPKTEDSIFPPAQTPRKVDIELETGEYFLQQAERRRAHLEQRLEREAEVANKRRAEREKAFEPPKETDAAESRRSGASNSGKSADLHDQVTSLKRKLKRFKPAKKGNAS